MYPNGQAVETKREISHLSAGEGRRSRYENPDESGRLSRPVGQPKKRTHRKTAPNSIKSESPGVGLVHQSMFGRRAGFDHGIGQELLHRETKAASGTSIVL